MNDLVLTENQPMRFTWGAVVAFDFESSGEISPASATLNMTVSGDEREQHVSVGDSIQLDDGNWTVVGIEVDDDGTGEHVGPGVASNGSVMLRKQ